MTGTDRETGLKGASRSRKIPHPIWILIKSVRTGKNHGEDDGNPLQLDRKGVLWHCAVATIIALIFYIILISIFTTNLVNKIERTSALYSILSESVIYPNKVPLPTSQSRKEVDDVAVYIWLQELGVMAPGESFKDGLADDGSYTVLANALRFGSKCNQNKNARVMLSLPDVQRLSVIATYLAEPCKQKVNPAGENVKTAESDLLQAKQKEITGLIIARIAGLAPICGRSFFEILLTCWSNLFGESKGPSGQASVKSIFETMSVYSGRDAKERQNGKESEIIVRLRKLIENSSSVDLLDIDITQISKVNEFELSLLSRINAQPEVVSARQWLTIFRGWEQYAILTLVFILSTLLFMRYRNLRSQEYGTNRLLDRLKLEMDKPDDGDKKQVFAKRLVKLKKELQILNPRTSRVAEDLANATLADLKSLSTIGVTEEHLQSVSNRIEKKLELSRTMMDWGIATLPALGFLGTVHGILNALQGVGGLSQGDPATRMATLISVSGSLGLAFATTLLALAFMIPLSFIDARIARFERNLIMTTEEYFATKFLV